ncbi:MAG: hypothetical protein ACM32J_09780 [Rhizobacter sp.]
MIFLDGEGVSATATASIRVLEERSSAGRNTGSWLAASSAALERRTAHTLFFAFTAFDEYLKKTYQAL